MEAGQQFSLWMVRVAVALWFAFAIFRLKQPAAERTIGTARWLWVAATGCYLIHVLTAFAYFHDWSHDAATRHTAQTTERVTGLGWGGGIWFNHLFTLVVLAETIAWCTAPLRVANRGPWLNGLVYGWCLFIGFNATVVFATGWFRVVCVAGFAGLCVLMVIKRNRWRRQAG